MKEDENRTLKKDEIEITMKDEKEVVNDTKIEVQKETDTILDIETIVEIGIDSNDMSAIGITTEAIMIDHPIVAGMTVQKDTTGKDQNLMKRMNHPKKV